MIILLASTFTFGQCKLDYSNYHLVFEDYFQTRGAGAYTGVTSGANPLSTNYTFTGDPDPLGGWGDYTDGFGTVHYGEYYDPSQVSFIPGGGIQLEADRITTPITLSNGRVPTYKSGILRTISTYEYGMFEITAALYVAPCPMDKPGCEYSGWPTFWLATDPDLSEIDVFDGPNPNSARQMKTNVINNISHASCGRFSQKLDADLTKYNTYTCVWTPTKVSFFFNGREMFTTDNSVVSLTPVFNHIYLTLQMCDYFYPDVSYYDIKSLKVYQANINAKTGIPDYDASYQSSKEFMNYDIFGDPGAPLVEAVSSN